jgi:hypothetical protein
VHRFTFPYQPLHDGLLPTLPMTIAIAWWMGCPAKKKQVNLTCYPPPYPATHERRSHEDHN